MKKSKWAAWTLAVVFAANCVVPAMGMVQKEPELEMPAVERNNEQADAALTDAGSEIVSLIVELDGEALLASGAAPGTPEAEACAEAIRAEQEQVMRAIRVLAGDDTIEIGYRYTMLVNGFSVCLPEWCVEKVRMLPGVARVCRGEWFCTPETAGEATLDSDRAVTAADMIGVEEVWAMGYDGSGMVIALLDTGLDVDHPSFADDLDEKTLGLTEDEVGVVLEHLNACQRYENIAVEDVHLSNKVPFVFNYADGVPDVSHEQDNQGDHGTHVAGIAAANDLEGTEAVGIAPEAQLVILKVFGSEMDGTSEEVLLAALEDAVILGCDVINMSFGTAAGFSQEGQSLLEKAIGQAMDAGIILCAAAGNDYHAAYGNILGTDLPGSGQVEFGTVSYPASASGVLAVGSVESAGYYTRSFAAQSEEGERELIEYLDSGVNFGLNAFSTLGSGQGETYDFVVVPGIGTAEETGAVELTGAVAVIARGEIPFAEKARNAFDAGAAAVVIYNNTAGAVSMDLSELSGEYSFPCVIVSREAGERLTALAGETGRGRITVFEDVCYAETENGGIPSEFSSWGTRPDLTLKPDFCSVGGMVYSTLDHGTCGTMSGTSMAAPQAAGALALILEYLEESCGLTGSRAGMLAQTLLMNTARPVLQENGREYSPRKQGAGLINVAAAVTTPVYLTVEGSELPKGELGDDPAKTGVYEVVISAHNESEGTVYYVPEASVLTESEEDGNLLLCARALDADVTFSVEEGELTFLYDFDGDGDVDKEDADPFYDRILSEPNQLSVSYFDMNSDGRVDGTDAELFRKMLFDPQNADLLDRVVVTIPAGETVAVTVTVCLTAPSKHWLNDTFENGIYVDGYVKFGALGEESEDLSVPVLAFYGDWSCAPLFETYSLADLAADGGVAKDGNCTYPMEVITGAFSYLGMNPEGQDAVYIPARSNALNTSGGEGGVITDLYLDLLRDARNVTVEMVDSAGRTLCSSSADRVNKSSYSEASGYMIPAVWSAVSQDFAEFIPADYGLADGDNFTIRVSGEKAADGKNRVESFTIPVYVDGTAPEVSAFCVNRGNDLTNGCKVSVAVRDNFYVACVLLLSADGETVMERFEVDQRTLSATTWLTIDVTEHLPVIGGEFTIGVVDYAHNMTVHPVSVLWDSDGSFLPNDSLLICGTWLGNRGWYMPSDEEDRALETALLDDSHAVCAAEQVGGYLFTVERSEADRLNVIDTRTYRTVHQIPLDQLKNYDEVIDLAYVDEERILYVLACVDGAYSVFCVDVREETMEPFMTVDDSQMEGFSRVYALAGWKDGGLALVVGMALDKAAGEEAQLYTMQKDGSLEYICGLNMELNTATMSAEYAEESETLYISCYNRSYAQDSALPVETCGIYRLDAGSEEISPELWLDCGGAVINSLVWTGDTETVFDPDTPLSRICLNNDEVHLLKGDRVSLSVESSKPWYASRDGWWLSLSSSDPAVIRTYHNGMIAAVGEGEARVTVTLFRPGETAVSAECTVVVEAPPVMYALTEAGSWQTIQTDTWETVPAGTVMDGSIALAAYGAGAGSDGTDVIFGLDRGDPTKEGKTAAYTLITVDAETWTTADKKVLSVGSGTDEASIPEEGFSDLAYDPYTGYLVAVSGTTCFVINPVSARIYRSYSLESVCSEADLAGVAFSEDGCGWFLDSAGVLHETTGFLSGFQIVNSVAVIGERLCDGCCTAMEWDQLRDVLWIAWGSTVYRAQLPAQTRDIVPVDVMDESVCSWFMKHYH